MTSVAPVRRDGITMYLPEREEAGRAMMFAAGFVTSVLVVMFFVAALKGWGL